MIIHEVSIDGFELLVEIEASNTEEIEIIDLYDGTLENRLDNDLKAMILDDNYDAIIEEIEEQKQIAMGDF